MFPSGVDVDIQIGQSMEFGAHLAIPKIQKDIESTERSEKEYRLFHYRRHGILLGDVASRVNKAAGDFSLRV
jgi:hypothetical protein